MDGILEGWIQDACVDYCSVLCDMTSLTELQAKAQFIKEEWNSNTLRKACQIAKFRGDIINEKG